MKLLGFGIAITFLIMFSGTAIAFENNINNGIQRVDVECSFSQPVPLEVQNRIIATLEKTLETVLLDSNDRSLDSYIVVADEIRTQIMEGLNIVLRPRGYQIESFHLDFDKITKANFSIGNYGTPVRSIKIVLNTGNFHQFWENSLQTMLSDAQPDLRHYYEPLLIGLPVNAEHRDWAYSLVKDQSEDSSILNHVFFDMKAKVSVSLLEHTVINVILESDGQIAATLRVRPYSRSMFQLALDPLKELITSNSNIVVGMPISWLTANQAKIENEFCRILGNNHLSRKFQLDSNCRLYFVERDPDAVYLEFKIESRKWNFRAEVMVDMGNDENPTEFEGHVGMLVGGHIESFILLNFYPDTITFRPDIGFGLHLFNDSFAGVGWDINEGVGKLYFSQYLSPYTRLHAEIFTEKVGQDQFGIIYKPFQFVSFGLFTDADNDYWMRASFAF